MRCVQDEESGTKPLIERQAFLNLMQASLVDDFEAIVVFKLDRLTRNWDDVTLIEKHFRENWHKCKLISLGDTVDLSNASGRAMFRVAMVFNCYMPEDMKEKQVVGIERAKAEGKYKGGKKGRRWAKNGN
jgi:DNA invertase Pin-like site-specific DNA recombinase